MKTKYFYIEPMAFSGYDKLEHHELINLDLNLFSDFELIVNDWPLDFFFDNSFAYMVDERLYSIIIYSKISGVRFKKITKISKGPDFDIYPDDTILPSFREMEITGIPFQDDFGIFKLPIGDGYFREYLVASEKAVELLVLNNCIELRGEMIEEDPNDYFAKRRQKSINSLGSIVPRFEQRQFLKEWD